MSKYVQRNLKNYVFIIAEHHDYSSLVYIVVYSWYIYEYYSYYYMQRRVYPVNGKDHAFKDVT